VFPFATFVCFPRYHFVCFPRSVSTLCLLSAIFYDGNLVQTICHFQALNVRQGVDAIDGSLRVSRPSHSHFEVHNFLLLPSFCTENQHTEEIPVLYIRRIVARSYFRSISRQLGTILGRKAQGTEGRECWHEAEPGQEALTIALIATCVNIYIYIYIYTQKHT